MYLLILLLAIHAQVPVWFYIVFSIVFAFKAMLWYAKLSEKYNSKED